MTKRFYRHKLLLDENFPVRSYFPVLNRRYDVKHITADLNHESLSDKQVYKIAQQQTRLVVTYNIKDFLGFVENDKKAGVIGVSPNLAPDQIDKKLTALLTKSTSKFLLGKLTTISEETG